ncbi:GNAT family N-acetyltransferase [Ensifer canadensis]
MIGVDFCSLKSSLPHDFDDLRNDAATEGYRFIERLHEDWHAGRMRFDGRGEKLLIASIAGRCAGVGGLTLDLNVLRVRRFYVRPQYRGTGLGRGLAKKLFEHAIGFGPTVTVNAGTAEAGLFWERMGFQQWEQTGVTHLLRL